ncbi:hypothetical protein SAMN06265379_11422 [Saccharicrinis carchari]|uniref:Uncharacterized protein n=1 Tax=Saccharicrinis carchari TaxID=1168039 RepID=A0A521F3R4_SACCC|nr:hypothetical protein [Saccharicrinis carchari]SMO90858.1 hypothetical protein SAMN06265379_11422 [Saccharicrinis carchari]
MKEKDLGQEAERAIKYYSQFDINEPTEQDWRHWLGTLPKNIAVDFFDKGFSYSLKSIPFQAWYLEEIKGVEED